MATKTTTRPDGAATRVAGAAVAPVDMAADVRAARAAPDPESARAHEPADLRDDEVEGSKRRMPDNLRRYLIKMQGGKMYLPAAYRIVWFRDELGDDWGIRTELVEGGHEAGFATVHAEVLNPEGRVIASGHKTEAKSDFPAGWVEKAESGAVARALALLGFGTQFTPELDDEGFRPADSPQPRHVYAPQRPALEHRPAPERPREDRPARAAVPDGLPADQPSTAAAAVAATAAAVPASEIWEGPGQCPRCHAPEGKRHGRQCLGQ